MAWKSQYANELELTVSRFRAVSGQTKQQLREGQLVGRMMLQRLATGATGVKQARYRRRPTRGSEALARACAVYTHTMYVLLNVRLPPRVLHFNCLVCLCICLSVCLSVPALAASASVGTSKQRYLPVSLRLFLD